MNLVELEDAPLLGAPPGDGIVRPRKNTLFISQSEPSHGEISPNSQQPFLQVAIIAAWFREPDLFFQEGNHVME